jgi:hypothetical protein
MTLFSNKEIENIILKETDCTKLQLFHTIEVAYRDQVASMGYLGEDFNPFWMDPILQFILWGNYQKTRLVYYIFLFFYSIKKKRSLFRFLKEMYKWYYDGMRQFFIPSLKEEVTEDLGLYFQGQLMVDDPELSIPGKVLGPYDSYDGDAITARCYEVIYLNGRKVRVPQDALWNLIPGQPDEL